MASGRWAIFLLLAAPGCVQRAVLTPPVAVAPLQPAAEIAGAVSGDASRFLIRQQGSSVKVFAFDIATGNHTLVFRDFHGLLVIDRSTSSGLLTFNVDLRTVTAGSSIVTDIIRDELLEVSLHPRSRLVAALRPGDRPDEYSVQGNMLLHGVEHGIRFVGTLRPEGDGYRFSTVFNMSRAAFAIRRTPKFDWMTSDDFRVQFDLLATPEKVTVEVIES